VPDAKRAQLEAFLRDPRGWDERSHGEWTRARDLTSDKQEQAAFAPAEHRAFARELVAEQPYLAPAVPLASLGYYLAKKAGLKRGRSEADFDAVWAALEGTGSGLKDAVTGRPTPKDPKY
jgi:hypothetical protein